jgi:hypothetical protein
VNGDSSRPIRDFGISEPLALAIEAWERATYSSPDALVMGSDVAQWMANELEMEHGERADTTRQILPGRSPCLGPWSRLAVMTNVPG